MKYTFELLAPIVASSKSVTEVMRKLGLRIAGGSHWHISKRIKQLQLNTAHFLGVASSRGNHNCRKRNWQEILILGACRVRTKYLRIAMLEYGIAHACATCGQGPEWHGKPLVLQIEHKNGNSFDNRPSNVEFLCPNCHTQTSTYARARIKCRSCPCGRRIRRSKNGLCWWCLAANNKSAVNICICGKQTENMYCSYKCARRARQIIDWPDNLPELVKQSSAKAMAKQLGVSDKAIAKRLKNHHTL